MFMSLIRKRRSIRKYADRPVEEEKIDCLIEAALRAPSSRGFNPWEFVVVRERDLLERLAGAKPHGSSFLRWAALGIVVCGRPDRSDVWVEDCSIASIFIQLAAESMGLGSCWIQIRKRPHDETRSAEAYVAETLGIPAGTSVESIIAVGYPLETKPGHAREKLQFDKIRHGRYE